MWKKGEVEFQYLNQFLSSKRDSRQFLVTLDGKLRAERGNSRSGEILISNISDIRNRDFETENVENTYFTR